MSNDDDRIDEIIRSAADDYNSPPATPRDEMWAAIQAARSAPGPRLHVTTGGAAPLGGYATSRSYAGKYAWLGAAAAAVLLVATGVGIGRWTSANGETDRRVAGVPSLIAPAVTRDTIVAPDDRSAPDTRSVAAASESRLQVAELPAATRTHDEIRRNPVVTGNGELRRVVNGQENDRTPAPDRSVQTVSYQVATQQHLQDAEVLLTSFSIESRDERMNSQFAGWAKSLLSNTRLLLDSPAGDDQCRASL